MYDVVIVRYGEIFLKGEPVKKRFERQLIENIKLKLKKKSLQGEILRERHRIYIQTDNAKKVADSLKSIFGIVSLSPAIETKADIGELGKVAADMAEKIIDEGDTFAVRVKRTGRHGFSSKDVEEKLGDMILDSINTRVDLSHPDKTIYAEVKDGQGFVFDEKIRGVGGLPYKTQGKVIALISGGVDSSVAAWMIMRRGCEIIALHFGSTDEVEEIIERLQEYSVHRIKTYAIPYDEILKTISEKAEKYTCIVCKRMMYKIADRIKEIEDAHGIVTGESMGQVASQTLENLEILSEVTSPIYRPLIGMDKQEIIKRAREIGAYELSVDKKCVYLPAKPSTKANPDKIREIEKAIDFEIDKWITR